MSKRKILIVLGIIFVVLFAAVLLKSKPTPSVTQATRPQIGFTAPDFTLKDLNGNIVKLSDLRGKPVYLNFWASWCPPCKVEIPEIQKFYQQNKDKVTVLAIDLTFNDKLSDVIDMLKANNANFPVLLDTNANSSVADSYQVYGIPESFFIDKNGVIREKHVGGMSLDMLQEGLKKAL